MVGADTGHWEGSVAGVLTRHVVDIGQNLARPGREVAQVADRRAHEPQRSLHGSRVTR